MLQSIRQIVESVEKHNWLGLLPVFRWPEEGLIKTQKRCLKAVGLCWVGSYCNTLQWECHEEISVHKTLIIQIQLIPF